MFRISKCSLVKLFKLLILTFLMSALYFFYVGNSRKNQHPINKLRNDFIDPDKMQRDPDLYRPQNGHASKSDVIPNVYTFNKALGFNHTCVPLKVGKKSPLICVYASILDSMISKHVARFGTWEGEHLAVMVDMLEQNKDMHLVDLGCNIGVYTIIAASMGRKVIAVDPVETNLQLLDKSLKLTQIRDRVTLVHNAVSDKPEMVSIDLRIGNIGGSHVNSVPSGNRRSLKRFKRSKTLDYGEHIRQEKPLKRVKRFKRIVKKPHRNKKSVPGRKNQQNKIEQKPNQKKTGKPKVKVSNLKLANAKPPKIKAKDTHAIKANHKAHHKTANKVGKKKPNGKDGRKPVVKKSVNSISFDNHLVEKQNMKKVPAITLNDLSKLKTFKPTYVKMDIEGWEHKALSNSDLFRQAFDVRCVFMEWSFHRNNPRQSKIATMMIQNGFLPYRNASPGRFESLMDEKRWPDNVYWKKR